MSKFYVFFKLNFVYFKGYDPETFRGKNIGVFFGSYSVGSDSIAFPNVDTEKFDGYILLGCSQSLVANRISYAFDFKGESH